MFGFKKKEKQGPMELDSVLSRVVADEWEKVPADCDHWMKFKMVRRSHADSIDVFDVRIFDEWAADKQKIKVLNYAFLDTHPDLVLFEGSYNKATKKVELKMKKAA